MNISILKNKFFKLTETQMAGILLFLYFSIPFFTTLFRYLLDPLSLGALARPIAIALSYVPLMLLFLTRRRFIVWDFIIILIFIITFFMATYLFHPEYEHWYTREYYGVWPYVLRPDNGLYSYLFLRLVNDPKAILKYLRFSGWVMYIYFAYRLLIKFQVGYWLDEDYLGRTVERSYNLSYGYDVLLFALVFFYEALEQRKIIDWVSAGIGFLMILLGGSRGPILDIAIFVVLYVLMRVDRSRRRGWMIALILALAALIYLTYDIFLLWAAQMLRRFNISSRFISMLISGNISSDSGRTEIWNTTIDMIKKKPWGYGAMGTRHVISKLHIVGHPHQLFLELLVDFGVLFGGIIILFLLYNSVKILSMTGHDNWRGLFIVFFSRACQLLLSLTYWHSIGLWSALAIGVCISRSCWKGSRRKWKATGLEM